MRARHRHFNAAHCGGDLLLDSRYLALNNNDAVSSWTNRANASNNASQSGSTERPTYLTNQLNGNPAVSFDGSNDWVSWTGAKVRFALTVYERTGTQARYGALWGSTGGTEQLFGDSSAGTSNTWIDHSVANTQTSTAKWRDGTWTYNGSAFDQNAGGSVSQTASIVTALLTDLSTNTISRTRERDFGSRVPFARVYQLFTSQTNFANSIAKRIRHAAAFSFKISCN